MKSAAKSNTWVVVVPTILWFVMGFVYLRLWQEAADHHFDYLLAAGLGIPFIAMAIAQLRSGYLWRNLTPGNRGEHRSGSPGKFLFATIVDFVIGIGIVWLFASLHAASVERGCDAESSGPVAAIINP